jgi:hypothetical protein
MALDPTTNQDVQEALSRRYSDDIIMLLPLKSGAIGVLNSARELCGILNDLLDSRDLNITEILDMWHPPTAAPTFTKPPVDLEELDLI